MPIRSVSLAAATLTVMTLASPAVAQHASVHVPWGISPTARYVPQRSLSGTGVRVEFASDGPPQVVAQYLGTVERGSARVSNTETVSRDLCTTPCSLRMRAGDYQLITRGPGVVSGLHHYVVPALRADATGTRQGVRFHLRARPASVAIVAGVAIAAAILTTLASFAVFADEGLNHTDTTPGWVVLGVGVGIGLFGTGMNAWAQSTGISSVERIPDP